MNEPRYETTETNAGHYVYDRRDELPIGEPFHRKMLAEIEAGKLNRAETAQKLIIDRVIAERAAQDEQFPTSGLSSGTWLAVLTKKVGDSASSLLTTQARERNLEQELIEVAAVALAWLEDLDRSR